MEKIIYNYNKNIPTKKNIKNNKTCIFLGKKLNNNTIIYKCYHSLNEENNKDILQTKNS
jgi:hypothetical protein